MITHGVEVKQPLGVLEDEALLQAQAAFIDSVAEIPQAPAAMGVDAAESFAHLLNQLPHILPLGFRKPSEVSDETRVEISL